MAEERDPQVSRRYRELGGEEPPSALDASILQASRRAVAPSRWRLPLAAAAVAVLAVAIAVLVERAPQEARRESAPVPQTAPAAGMRSAPATAREPAPADSVAETPERWLARVAELRRQERHEEADKSLADFRRRYPDYPIPESALERIEKK
jgi:hypothetical protein